MDFFFPVSLYTQTTKPAHNESVLNLLLQVNIFFFFFFFTIPLNVNHTSFGPAAKHLNEWLRDSITWNYNPYVI